ncbi:hypothetical protein GCM10025857_62080 [Alicyclobacillus contaminans]|nr:hypothetical protein GCM10025857_62080 [Alicyclobacillus contaminans]
MREIQAAKNNKIKALKKLHQRKYRNQSEDYLLEGYHLIEEAAKAHAEIKEIFWTKEDCVYGKSGWKTINLLIICFLMKQ